MDYLLIALYGAAIGSFANVCIYRLPKEQSIIWKPSHCLRCKKKILWYDNIPLFSYLKLNGKCRKCKKKISLQYFLVEFILALIFLTIYLIFGMSTTTLYFMIFSSIGIIIFFIDLKHYIIPDSLNFLLMAVGLLKSFDPSLNTTLFPNLVNSIIGGGVGYLIIFSIIYFYKKLRNIDGMGLGDAKLLAALGFWFGWKAIPCILFFSSLIALAWVLPSLYSKRKNLLSKIPFGPYLIIGTIAYVLLLEQIQFFI